jgi:hypothetical protein
MPLLAFFKKTFRYFQGLPANSGLASGDSSADRAQSWPRILANVFPTFKGVCAFGAFEPGRV